MYVMIIDYLLFLGMFDDCSGDRCGVETNKASTQSLSRHFDGSKPFMILFYGVLICQPTSFFAVGLMLHRLDRNRIGARLYSSLHTWFLRKLITRVLT